MILSCFTPTGETPRLTLHNLVVGLPHAPSGYIYIHRAGTGTHSRHHHTPAFPLCQIKGCSGRKVDIGWIVDAHGDTHSRGTDETGNLGVACIYRDGLSYKQLRHLVVEGYLILDGLLHLPAEVFAVSKVNASVHEPEGIGGAYDSVGRYVPKIIVDDLNRNILKVGMPRHAHFDIGIK